MKQKLLDWGLPCSGRWEWWRCEMEIDKIRYQVLLNMGFERKDIDDDVLFRQTGYSGFAIEREFPVIDVGISSGCFMSNDKQAWDFKLYKVSTGDIIRNVELVEISNLIKFFHEKSKEIKIITNQVKEV